MHSSTIIASIIVLVTIAAKHSSVATHDSYLQALRRRTHAYNYDKNQQRNMFLRRLAQQLIEDEDSDESLRSAAWKRDNSAGSTNICGEMLVNQDINDADTYDGSWNPMSATTNTAEECRDRCQSFPDCVAWSFRKATFDCNPMVHVDGKPGSYPGYTSGFCKKATASTLPPCNSATCCATTNCIPCDNNGTPAACRRARYSPNYDFGERCDNSIYENGISADTRVGIKTLDCPA
ncbi:unnamed protein product [Adineta steineri]|uniref:Apple domain-containing protein n=2 Tax=Adineta steineri TaxID=433720 RepID=A0A815QD38_9BILA|nr:unnamed protein product [Adineta steineri]CAF1633543.1 unnamed protein product [Adineta steineri]